MKNFFVISYIRSVFFKKHHIYFAINVVFTLATQSWYLPNMVIWVHFDLVLSRTDFNFKCISTSMGNIRIGKLFFFFYINELGYGTTYMDGWRREFYITFSLPHKQMTNRNGNHIANEMCTYITGWRSCPTLAPVYYHI